MYSGNVFEGFDLTPEQEQVLNRDNKDIWNTLILRNRISAKDFEMLTDLDHAPAADQSAHFDDEVEGPIVAKMFMSLFSQLTTVEYERQLRYVSLWLRILLLQNPERGRHFFQLAGEAEQNPLKTFVHILFMTEMVEFPREIMGNVAVCASIILQNEIDYAEGGVDGIAKWLTLRLKTYSRPKAAMKHEDFLESVSLALKNSLKNNRIMSLLCCSEDSSFSNDMFNFMSVQTNIQVLYYSGFALLLVALKKNMGEHIANHANLCKLMISLISSAKKEKIQRIYLNVIECLSQVSIFSEMCVMYGLYPLLERLSESKFKDEDLGQLVIDVRDRLRPYIRVMSSMERYKKELETKTLEWGPVHTEKFWKKNFMNFAANEFQSIKELCSLLDSQDETTVSVAAHDLGEFARLYPDGRRLVGIFGAKNKLFFLLNESFSEDVKKQCLLATQKILIQNWQQIE